MKQSDISNIRLINQHISEPKFESPREIANRMGAIQAQDFPMSKWAYGTRLINSTDKLIETAFDRGDILRIHLLRPTWHLVSGENIRWLLNLTGPVVKARLRSRQKSLDLTESLLKKCNRLMEDSLKGENHMTSKELAAILAIARIPVDNQRAYHILVNAELEGVICSGRIKGGKQTYALLDERVPDTRDLTREDALRKIAGIYFSSRGPAALQDFIWWSGLSVTDARNALESIKPDLVSEKTDSGIYWFSNPGTVPEKENISVHLLPAFDEYLISYKDRSASVPYLYQKKTFSDNGIFWPIIVIDGQARGIWKRTIKKDKVIIEARLFEPINKTIKNLIEKQSELFGQFLDKKTETIFIIG